VGFQFFGWVWRSGVGKDNSVDLSDELIVFSDVYQSAAQFLAKVEVFAQLKT
jgi:hypothetical protein